MCRDGIDLRDQNGAMTASAPRDLLLHSGRVVTPDRSPATAVLISDERILAVGGEEIVSAVGVGVARIDLRGAW